MALCDDDGYGPGDAAVVLEGRGKGEALRRMTADGTSQGRWYARPFVVILLLFFVLGPFGLPLLFKSPGFGRVWKIILTVAVIIYTVYLVYASLKIGTAVYEGAKWGTALSDMGR